MSYANSSKPNRAMAWAQTLSTNVHSIYTLVHSLVWFRFMSINTVLRNIHAWCRSSTEPWLPSFRYMGKDTCSLGEENAALREQVPHIPQ